MIKLLIFCFFILTPIFGSANAASEIRRKDYVFNIEYGRGYRDIDLDSTGIRARLLGFAYDNYAIGGNNLTFFIRLWQISSNDMITSVNFFCCSNRLSESTPFKTINNDPNNRREYYGIVLDINNPFDYNSDFLDKFGGDTQLAGDSIFSALKSGNISVVVGSKNAPNGALAGYYGIVPEPATWSTIIIGFGLAGTFFRRNRRRILRFSEVATQ